MMVTLDSKRRLTLPAALCSYGNGPTRLPSYNSSSPNLRHFFGVKKTLLPSLKSGNFVS